MAICCMYLGLCQCLDEFKPPYNLFYINIYVSTRLVHMMSEINYYIPIYDKFSLDYQEVILNPSIL